MNNPIDKKKLKDKSPDDLRKILADAWLNMSFDEDKLFDPLARVPDHIKDKPHLWYTYLMMQPEYFSFLCKEILNTEILPFQGVILKNLWEHKFNALVMSRGGGKSWVLGLYSLLRCLLLPQRKVVVVGAAFRQSKIIYQYARDIYLRAPLLRDIVGSGKEQGPHNGVDRCYIGIGDSKMTALPIGTGDTIRGERATEVISDEFAAQNEEIFNTVISGFLSVRAGVSENVKREAQKKLAHYFNIELEDEDEFSDFGNQLIVSGTGYYQFNHFYKTVDTWRKFVHSKGDLRGLRDCFPDGEVPEGFDWEKFCVMRIPYELLPKGMMEEDQINRAKAASHTAIFNQEYGACFSKDSSGFFKASLIQSCVANIENNIKSGDELIHYSPLLKGEAGKSYIYGIDPASEVDNFSVVVLEMHKDHRRVVYVWTTNSSDFKAKRKTGEIDETDYYAYCCRKIRDLMAIFPCAHIALDAQGGGKAIYEGLHNSAQMREGELPMWEFIEPGKPKDSDGERGLHLIELVQFSNYEYVSTANHGMRKDLEDRVLLFPEYSPAMLAIYSRDMEENVIEIEELKDELVQIIVERTPSGRERWDTPEIKLEGNKKGRLKKDRYSALLMANMAARRLAQEKVLPAYEMTGGFAGVGKVQGQNSYIGPAWLTDKLNDLYR